MRSRLAKTGSTFQGEGLATRFAPAAKRRLGVVEVLAIGLALAFLTLGLVLRESSVRYLSYACPVIVIAYGIATTKGVLKFRVQELTALLVALIVLAFAAIRSPVNGWPYVVFILVSLTPLTIGVRVRKEWLLVLLWLLCAYQLWVIVDNGLSNITLGQSLGASETDTVPGIAGLLAGAFLLLRQRTAAVIALLLVVVGGKRIVLLSVIAGFAFAFAYHRYFHGWVSGKRLWRLLGLYGLILLPLFVLALYLPFIFQEIGYRLDLSADAFSSGRLQGQQKAYDALRASGAWELLFGRGLGQADLYAKTTWDGTTLIHNDYLRMLIDLGVIGSIIFLVTYLRLIGFGRLGPYVVAYTATLWLTGNALVFAFYVFVVCFVILVGRDEAQMRHWKEHTSRRGVTQRKARRLSYALLQTKGAQR